MQAPEYYTNLNLEAMLSGIESTADVGGVWIDILKFYFSPLAYRLNPESVMAGGIKTDRLLLKRETHTGPRVQRWPVFVLEYKYAKPNEEHPTEAQWEKSKEQLKEYLMKLQNLPDIVSAAIAVNTYIRLYEYGTATKEITTVKLKVWDSGIVKIDLDLVGDRVAVAGNLQQILLKGDSLGG